MDSLCLFSHKIPDGLDVCHLGHPRGAALRCDFVGCDFVTKSVPLRYQIVAENLLRSHCRKEHEKHFESEVSMTEINKKIYETSWG